MSLVHLGALYRVSSETFTAGLIVRQGKVVHAAPILRWLIGKTVHEVGVAAAEHGWQIERLQSSVDNEAATIL